MDRGAKIRGVLAVIVAVNMALVDADVTFGIPAVDIAIDTARKILSIVVLAVCYYYNNPTSEINCIKTGEMRQYKAEQAEGYDGERMFMEDEDEH